MQVNKLTVAIDGTNLHYLQAGTGPPLVLVHGLLGGSFCWRHNLEALSKSHMVFAVDMPGLSGDSAHRKLDCSMPAQAERLSSLLVQLGLENVNLVGCSWGGAIAMFLAARYSRLRSLVLVAPVNPWSDLGSGRIRFLNGKLGAALLRTVWPFSRPLHRTAVERMYGDRLRVPPGTIDGYSSAMMKPGRVHSILNTLRSWQNDVNALTAAIPRISVPSLLIWGTRDGAVDLRSAQPLCRALPDSRLALIEGAGHLPFEETPQEFNRLVLEFLDRPDRPNLP